MMHWQAATGALFISCTLASGCGIEPDPGDADAHTPDAQIRDAGTPDAAPSDAAPVLPDAMPSDAALNDAVPPDAAPHDAAPHDAAPPGDGGPACGPERCNGLDDDCDGRTDEHFNLGSPCTAGVGACVTNGERECAPSGQVRCSATPGQGGNEVCDGLDNDCDAAIDEDVVNACGQCGPPPEELCDRLDNDCDGVVDEGIRNACGACAPAPADLCDLRDNDCDGLIDEDFVPEPCMVGVGACAQPGVQQCDRRRFICVGDALPPVPEQCGDGIDNDCDGATDEGQPTCTEQTGRCVNALDPICDDDGWRCPEPQIDPPVPPECEVGPGNPPRVEIAQDVRAFWALPPSAADPHVAIIWPANGTHIQRVNVAGAAVGEAGVAPLALQAVARAGEDFAGIEADAEGYRWVRFNAAGEVLARAPHFFLRTDEILQAEQLAGADIIAKDDGGFVVAFGAWHVDRLGFYTAHLDAAGVLVDLQDVGAVARPPALFKTPLGVLVATMTLNGVGWGGPQNGGLPTVGLYGSVLADRTISLNVRSGIVYGVQAMGTTDDALLYWQPNGPKRGVCLRRVNGETTHCYDQHVTWTPALVWQGQRGLLARFLNAPNGDDVGIRVQPIDADGDAIDVQRWIATQIVDPHALRLVAIPNGVLTLWSAGNRMFAQTSIDAVDVGDGPLCPVGQRALPADGACNGATACVDPSACVPDGPVCGCDGQDYPDRCAAIGHAVGVWRDGPCPVADWPCPDGLSDLDGPDDRCLPCTALQPVCGWRGDRFRGRVYANACAALEADPENRWSVGDCRTPSAEWCQEELCDQVCPICGIDGECYAERNIWGEQVCF